MRVVRAQVQYQAWQHEPAWGASSGGPGKGEKRKWEATEWQEKGAKKGKGSGRFWPADGKGKGKGMKSKGESK